MAHKTLVGGTAYNITGGKSMVSGTAYNIKGGRTLVGGTGYDIRLAADNSIHAMVYNGTNASWLYAKQLIFQRGNKVESGLQLYGDYTDFENVEYTSLDQVPWNAQRKNIYSVNFKNEIAPRSLQYWFYNCGSLSYFNYFNLNMNNITDMSNVFNSCTNLKMSPICGDKVTNMSNAYRGCMNIIDPPVCGNNVINMCYAYSTCHNLKSPVCGDKVKDMSYTYYYSDNLIGPSVCGRNVTSMLYTYAHCPNLTGSPVCGNNVINMDGAYYNCKKITGSPVCGGKVINMSRAYYDCINLTGTPICGNSVNNMYLTYRGCINLSSNAYFYSSIVGNCTSCFGNKNNSKRLNLFVPANSTTNTTVHYNNTRSLVGYNITWTDAGTYQYNTAYNIYIYPVANVAAAAIANRDEEANANAGIIVDGSGGNNTGGGSSSSANYTVASVSGASYGFALNSNGYYESGNKGQSSSAALCKVTFIADGVSNVYFDCINYGESNYDYGLLSTVDKTLTTSNSADSSNVFKNFKGSQSASVQTVNYGILSAGEHFVYVKYIKDGSVNSNNDSLQFKVRFE